MAHNHFYVIGEDKCWEESYTKIQIDRLAGDISHENTEISLKEVLSFWDSTSCYQYSSKTGNILSDVNTVVLDPGTSVSAINSAPLIFMYSGARQYGIGEKIRVDIPNTNTGYSVSVYICTHETAGEETIDLSNDCVFQGTVDVTTGVFYVDISIITAVYGIPVVVCESAGGETWQINNIKAHGIDFVFAQLKYYDAEVVPVTNKIVNVTGAVIPSHFDCENRREYRYLGISVVAGITINPVLDDTLGAETNYCSILSFPCVFAGTMTVSDLITFSGDNSANCVLINPELDVSAYTMMHVNLFCDGVKICAIVSGY